jgi:hypothetical protein
MKFGNGSQIAEKCEAVLLVAVDWIFYQAGAALSTSTSTCKHAFLRASTKI